MSSSSVAYPARLRDRARTRAALSRLSARPELLGLIGVTGLLNLWGLSVNGWANTYYSAAVRSMSSSWHDFLFGSLDRSGLMTVDKPPLSLWVQALSARVFGFHPLSVLVPQALMGAIAVALVYDLIARRFGRVAGFVGGVALTTTPVIVAVSRHNNPDELLVLCSVAAVWFAVRALESGRTRWLVLSGVAVGLGFETKMGVALMVVPGIVAAWMWTRARGVRGSLVAARQLLAGGVAMVLAGGAWPLLVALTPTGDRPWISGTTDNSIWSLIVGYNGLGRIAGQSGGPGGGGPGGGTMFGGATGPFRLLHSGLGDQAGWLLGFALVAGAGILVASRLRRDDQRTGWLIAVGGAFVTTAVAFSFAGGIFHPYYVSLLAPFSAGLMGAGVGQMREPGRAARLLAPAAIVAGVITELVVLGELNGALAWAAPLMVSLAGACAVALMLPLGSRLRVGALVAALAALLAAPAVWAADTVGHATNGTFPTGGPASVSVGGGPGGPGLRAGVGVGGPPGAPAGAAFAVPRAGGFAPPGGGAPPFATQGAPRGFGGNSAELTAAIRYAAAHGGGAIGVSSQSSAAEAILGSNASVAGLGGFSGRESSVTVSWIAQEVQSGHLRWVLADDTQRSGLPGDTRQGSTAATNVVSHVCRAVNLSGTGASNANPGTGSATATFTMYDCSGRAAALLRASNA